MVHRSLGLCAGLCVTGLGAVGFATAQEAPLSAIEWLSLPAPEHHVTPLEAPAATGLSGTDIEVTDLPSTQSENYGLLPSTVARLPDNVWVGTSVTSVESALNRLPRQLLPSQTDLLLRLLLVEAQDPTSANAPDFHALRIKHLLARGAVEQAAALAVLFPPHPTIDGLAFDAALLLGETDALCAQIVDGTRGVALAETIYCHTRAGQWQLADRLARSGQLSDLDAELMSGFLDPDVADSLSVSIPPADMTPLRFRVLESIGQRPSTATLPLALAIMDLSDISGWRTRLDALERLLFANAIPANQALGIYLSNERSASGAVWDRVESIHNLNAALALGEPALVEQAVLLADRQFQAAGLRPGLARIFQKDLAETPATLASAPVLRRLRYLTNANATQASTDKPGPLRAAAIEPAPTGPADPITATALLDAMLDISHEDPARLDRGRQALFRMGLVDEARRAKLDHLILRAHG